MGLVSKKQDTVEPGPSPASLVETDKGEVSIHALAPAPATIYLCGPGKDKDQITDIYPYAMATGSMWHKAPT